MFLRVREGLVELAVQGGERKGFVYDFGIEARCTVGGRCERPERSSRPRPQCARITQESNSVYQAAFDV